MIKNMIGVILIVVCAGGWFYLDYLNKQELIAAEEMRQAMIKVRAEAQARALAMEQAKAKFEAEIRAELAACKANADKASNDYIAANSKPIRKKPGQFNTPKNVQEEAAAMLAKGNVDCQSAYDTRLLQGRGASVAPASAPVQASVSVPVSAPIQTPALAPVN
jgi:hypothetical protein